MLEVPEQSNRNIIEVLVPGYGLTLNLLTTTTVVPPSNASKWQMGFNSAFKGLIIRAFSFLRISTWRRIILSISMPP
jgi:hypothetical protein